MVEQSIPAREHRMKQALDGAAYVFVDLDIRFVYVWKGGRNAIEHYNMDTWIKSGTFFYKPPVDSWEAEQQVERYRDNNKEAGQ